MNTTERIVESYFRLCRGCFTMSDVKVLHGNNRQIDLLAYNLVSGEQFHVEVSVAHPEAWWPTPDELIAGFEKKCFGVPEKREGPRTDHSKGRMYELEINQTYRSVGLDPDKIRRVWVCWAVKRHEELEEKLAAYCSQRALTPASLEILSFRDRVIADLLTKVSTANYDDDALRTLSLLQQFNLHKKRSSPGPKRGKSESPVS